MVGARRSRLAGREDIFVGHGFSRDMTGRELPGFSRWPFSIPRFHQGALEQPGVAYLKRQGLKPLLVGLLTSRLKPRHKRS